MTPAVFELDLTVTLSFLLAMATVVFTWWRTRDRNLDTRFDVIDQRLGAGGDRMDRHEARLASVEQTLRDMPQRKDVHELQLLLVEMRGQIMQLDERLKPVASIAERMQDLLIEQGRK